MTADRPPVLVLSGHLAAMGTIRCLGVANVPVVNIHYADSDFSHVSRHVRERIRAPHPERDEQGFVDLLIDCAQRFGRCLVVPANDATLGVVSRRKDELAVHHVVTAADWSVIKKVIDKRHTYASRKVFAVGDGMDVMPFLKRSFGTVLKRARRLERAMRRAASTG